MATKLVHNVIRQYKDIGLMDDPEFDKSRRKYDWRNYVPDKIRELWKDLTMESRIMVFITAESRSSLEQWKD